MQCFRTLYLTWAVIKNEAIQMYLFFKFSCVVNIGEGDSFTLLKKKNPG